MRWYATWIWELWHPFCRDVTMPKGEIRRTRTSENQSRAYFACSSTKINKWMCLSQSNTFCISPCTVCMMHLICNILHHFLFVLQSCKVVHSRPLVLTQHFSEPLSSSFQKVGDMVIQNGHPWRMQQQSVNVLRSLCGVPSACGLFHVREAWTAEWGFFTTAGLSGMLDDKVYISRYLVFALIAALIEIAMGCNAISWRSMKKFGARKRSFGLEVVDFGILRATYTMLQKNHRIGKAYGSIQLVLCKMSICSRSSSTSSTTLASSLLCFPASLVLTNINIIISTLP